MGDEAPDSLNIYVLPTEKGTPPRAMLFSGEHEPNQLPPDAKLVVWSRDSACWCLNGTPIPKELGDQITAHAQSLGVPW